MERHYLHRAAYSADGSALILLYYFLVSPLLIIQYILQTSPYSLVYWRVNWFTCMSLIIHMPQGRKETCVILCFPCGGTAGKLNTYFLTLLQITADCLGSKQQFHLWSSDFWGTHLANKFSLSLNGFRNWFLLFLHTAPWNMLVLLDVSGL